MAGTPECRKGRVVCFLASFPECGGNSAPVSGNTRLLRWLSPRAELGSGPLPVCNSSRAGSDHCHPLTSLFLFAAALPFPCPFVPQPHPGARTPARASAGTVHRESWPEICPAWPPPTAPLRAHPSAALIGCSCPALNRQGPLTRGKFSVPGGSWTFGDSEKAAAPEAAGVWAAMEEPPLREEEEEEGDEAGPEGALGKSPFQLTAEDVYDISYVMGRELMALGSDPRVTQLQFKIVRVLEMLETLVNEGSLTMEELRMERDNLRKEVEGLRRESLAAGREELRDVLQERNKLKSQLLVVQEELQCYKRKHGCWQSASERE
ncbi:RILP-like protein 2 isoform X5 [Delphinapterus leucas]|uniref:RILP-like protein 2 n=1 Tax=Delphinapterus leucas TaxID=9749 RepID=A0A2Y9QEB4_DELLE|nr:RILP-like protein 2 isoform X5 [Delphinapterus leucas]